MISRGTVYKRALRYRLLWGLVLAALACIGVMGAVSVGADEGFAGPSLLISTEQLEILLRDLDIRILDLRSPEKFREGRIPNALNLPAAAVQDPDSRLLGARRSDDELARMFGQLSIGKGTQVVLYDDSGGHLAARVLWMLHYFGHQNVSVLSGGFPKWQEEGRYVSQQTRLVKQEYFPLDLAPRSLATADWILEHLNDPDVVIVDVRLSEKYKESHIPGAINITWKTNLNPDDTWKSSQELQELYESAGVTKDKEIVVYCQGGNHNGHSYLTLKALGYPRVRSYDRAWPEWGSDPSLPKSRVLVQNSPADIGSQNQARVTGRPLSAGNEPQQRVATEDNSAATLSALDMGLIGGMGLLFAMIIGMVAVGWRLSRQQRLG